MRTTLFLSALTTLLCFAATPILAKAPTLERAHAIHKEHLRKRAARPDSEAQLDLVPRADDKKKKKSSKWHNDRTAPFSVKKTGFPEVPFELPESYAGMLPIDHSSDRELFFWFVPTENKDSCDEIVIWLNGGPGCSSMYGFIKENGPFTWQAGTHEPVKNHYAWNNLSNIVWVDQPVGTGYTKGKPNATSEDDVVRQFSGFWKNFVDLFGLQNRKIYITGESYAGMYVPYIADYFLNQSDTKYFNVSGIMVYDPAINHGVIHSDVPVLSVVENNRDSFPFNSSFHDYIANKSSACGFDDLVTEGLTFPPKGHFPFPKGAWSNGTTKDDCNMWGDAMDAIFLLNPCFNFYEITQMCPVPWDILGFPYSITYLPKGYPVAYFNKSEVKAALHVRAEANWTVCADEPVFIGKQGDQNDTDLSLPSGVNGGPLGRVIERTNNVIIGQGSLDFIIPTTGTLISINNLTWNGAQGFSKVPSEPFYVPAHDAPFTESISGSGVLGSWTSERGLTFVSVELAGHAVPGFAQSAGYRNLELLLGRIANLSDRKPFTTQPHYPQPNGTLGPGTSHLQVVLGDGGHGKDV